MKLPHTLFRGCVLSQAMVSNDIYLLCLQLLYIQFLLQTPALPLVVTLGIPVCSIGLVLKQAALRKSSSSTAAGTKVKDRSQLNGVEAFVK